MKMDTSGNFSAPLASWVCYFGDQPWINTQDFEAYFSLYLVLSVTTVLTSLAGISGNVLLMAGILLSPNLKTPSFRLIAFQAFSDLLMALFLGIIHVQFLISGLKQELYRVCILIDISIPVSWSISWVSALCSVCLSIDRYLAVSLSLDYRYLVTLRRIRIVVLLIWFTSPIPAIVFIFFLKNPMPNAYAIFVFSNVCYCVMSTCYIKALNQIRKHQVSVGDFIVRTNSTAVKASNKVTSSAAGECVQSCLEWKKYKRSTITLIIVEVIFVVLGIPCICAYIYLLFGGGPRSTSSALVIASSSFWYLVSAVNPIVHMYRMSDVRQACRTVLRRFAARIGCRS